MMGNFSKTGSSSQFNMQQEQFSQPPPAFGKSYQGYGTYNQPGQSFDGGNNSFGQSASSSRNSRWGNDGHGEEQRWGNDGDNWGNNRGGGGGNPARGIGRYYNKNRGGGGFHQRF